MVTPDVRQQYQTTDPLQTRILTHQRYSERDIDLHAACRDAVGLTGDEALLDVGCGPGEFLTYLHAHGHAGRLAGLDQSTGMIAAATSAAAAQGASIEWFVGEANALPFRDGEWQIVSARHMLYHVPDIPGALREFARVIGPQGSVLAVTNARGNYPHITALESDAMRSFGLPPRMRSPDAAFSTGNARALLESVFPHVEETILTNAFVFTTPAPIVAYIMTTTPMHALGEDVGRYQTIQEWLMAEATRRLADMGGVWRDPKDVGIYVCRLS
jgi:ubiquinone/menaquinone biosynthesis C-methylase UbiE